MKKVTRTIESHKIMCAEVKFVEGQVETNELEPITISNQGINDAKALKVVQKKYGKEKQYVITGIETTQTTYGIDFAKFMELAEVVERR